jgi:hypothetical protein
MEFFWEASGRNPSNAHHLSGKLASATAIAQLLKLIDVDMLSTFHDIGGLNLPLVTVFTVSAGGPSTAVAANAKCEYPAAVGCDAAVNHTGYDGHMAMTIATALSRLCSCFKTTGPCLFKPFQIQIYKLRSAWMEASPPLDVLP